MKKNFKNLIIAFILCFSFILVGCTTPPPAGQLDTKASVNLGNTQDYAVAEAADQEYLTTYITNNTAVEDMEGYRLTLTMSSGDIMNTCMNGIVQPTQTGYDIGIKVTATQGDVESSADVFVQNKVLAVEYKGGLYDQAVQAGVDTKFKTTIPQDIDQDSTIPLQEFTAFDFDFICESLTTLDFSDENITLKVNNQDNLKRFEITQIDNSLGTPMESKMYLIFENDKLTECKYDFSFFGLDIKIEIAKCTETIEFPNFNDFKEISYEDYLLQQEQP